MISGILLDALVGGVGCLAVALLALAGVFRRLSPRGRVILGASLALLLIVALLATQFGDIRTEVAQQASPSHATLIALSADATGLDTVTALSGHDGSALWRRPLGLYLVSGAIADDAVYLAGFAQPNLTQATLVALRLSDGASLWHAALPNAQQTPLRMIAVGGLLIALARTGSSADGSSPTYALIAIDRFSHATVWRVAIPSAPFFSGFGALATSSGLLFLGSTDGAVRALRLSDGAAAWSERISPPATATQPAATLGVVARGDALIVYDSTGEVASLRQRDGATLWGHPLPQPSYSYYLQQVTLASDSLYACGVDTLTHTRALMALNPLTGVTRWSRDAACDRVAPVESGGYVYLLNPMELTALRASDGALVWQGLPEESDLGYTTLQGDGGVVFAATTIANYRSIHVCGQWLPPGVSLCHNTQYIAAFNGVTGARYWRTADSYIGLLGIANG
jgi:outer membrane protein assembly factor BamB